MSQLPGSLWAPFCFEGVVTGQAGIPAVFPETSSLGVAQNDQGTGF
jgi:hypothetical protein